MDQGDRVNAWIAPWPAPHGGRPRETLGQPGHRPGPAIAACRFDIGTISARVRRARSGGKLRQTRQPRPHASAPDQPTVPPPARRTSSCRPAVPPPVPIAIPLIRDPHATACENLRRGVPLRPRGGVFFHRRRQLGPAGHQDHCRRRQPEGGSSARSTPSIQPSGRRIRPSRGSAASLSAIAGSRSSSSSCARSAAACGTSRDSQRQERGGLRVRARVRAAGRGSCGWERISVRPAWGRASAAGSGWRRRRGTGRRDGAAGRAGRRRARVPGQPGRTQPDRGPPDRQIRRCGRPAGR